jgi:hypothetical protein
VPKNRWAVSLAALALTSLAACGGDSDSSSDDSGSDSGSELEALTSEQAEQALLSEAVMGADFTAGEPSEESDEGAPGCLAALDDMDDIGAETEAEIEYASTSEVGLPSVEHSVFSYTEIDPISARIEEVSTALEGCTTVEDTDEDGTEYLLDVSVSTETTSEGAEEQITVAATGTITAEGQEIPLGVYMSSVRVENHVSVMVYTDIPEDEAATSAAFGSYVDAGAARLAAVAAGDEPAEEPVEPTA